MEQELFQCVEHLHKLIVAVCYLTPLFGLLIVLSFLITKSVMICRFQQNGLAQSASRYALQFSYVCIGSLILTAGLLCLAEVFHAPDLGIFSTLALASLIMWLFLRWKFQTLAARLQPLWKSMQPKIFTCDGVRKWLAEERRKWLFWALFLFVLLWVPDKMIRPWMVWIIPGYYLVRSVIITIKYLLSRKRASAQ